MRIFQHSVPVHLQIAIHSIWLVEDEVTRKQIQQVRAFPHGFVYISVNAEKKFKIRHGKIQEQTETKSYLCGQITRPSILDIPNVYRSLVIRFHPWVVPVLFGVSAADLVDQYISFEDIDDEFSRQLEELVEGEIPIESIGCQIEKIIESKLLCNKIDSRIIGLCKFVIQRKGAITTGLLSEKANLSNRRIQQLFKYFIGVSPKKFSRITRLQYFMFDAMTNADRFNLYDYYFDQPHFSREIKNLTGMTPLELEGHLSNFYARQVYLQTNLYLQ